ncbi:MAG TPA: hypothetical protein VIH54_00445 [Chthoniobacterales bacterium]
MRLNANGYIWTQTDTLGIYDNKHVRHATGPVYSAHLDGKVVMQAWVKASYMVIVTEDYLRSMEQAENLQ